MLLSTSVLSYPNPMQLNKLMSEEFGRMLSDSFSNECISRAEIAFLKDTSYLNP